MRGFLVSFILLACLFLVAYQSEAQDCYSIDTSRPEWLGAGFVRGDVQADGDHDLFDAIYLLNWLGGINPAPLCISTADAQDDGDADIFDAIYLLNWLGGINPPPPAPCCGIPGDCGADPTADELTCESYPPCADAKAVVDKTVLFGRVEENRLAVGSGSWQLSVGSRSSVSVPLIVTNAEPLLGFSCILDYDPSVVTATVVDNAGLITEGFDFFVGGVQEPGFVKIVALSDLDMGDGVDRLPAGEHEVARVVFETREALSWDVPLRVVESVMAMDGDRGLRHRKVDGNVSSMPGKPFELRRNR